MLTMLRRSFWKTAGLEDQDSRSKCLLAACVSNEIGVLCGASAAHGGMKCVAPPTENATDEPNHHLQLQPGWWKLHPSQRSSPHLLAHSGSVLKLDGL